MENKNYICYINTKTYFFDNADFNFDNTYSFHLEVDKSNYIYSYVLHVSKKTDITQPEGFWGSNISSVNVITGKNGAGKTSLLKFIINNIGNGITSMDGTGVIYIINENGKYIVFHNCARINIKKDDDCDIDIMFDDTYWADLRYSGEKEYLHSNKHFFRNIIFFSNYFGSYHMLKDDKFVINVSRDKEIEEVINSIDSLSELRELPIQSKYHNYRNEKLLDYTIENAFQGFENSFKISMPDLIRFKIDDSNNDYTELLDKVKNKLIRGEWIGIKRYSSFRGRMTHSEESKFHFEAAINKFSVGLMWSLYKEENINESILDTFINNLVETEELSGIQIAIELLKSCDSEQLNNEIRILDFLNDESNKCVLYWQTNDEFTYKLSEQNLELVRYLITTNDTNRFFTCDLVGSEGNGHYSSGEESKINFILSLLDALKKMENTEAQGDNDNIILLLDEIDAYYHPEYQINLMHDLLEIVQKVLGEYNVQIIIASNTPLELSDFPSENVTYIEQGKVFTEQNTVETFGNNVCNLLKNSFYVNSTMGAFAKEKIDKVIKFLTDEKHDSISKNEIKYIISIVGEPIIKNKLQELYYKKYPEELPRHDEEVAFYKSQIQRLNSQISIRKNIDTKDLEQLENALIKLSNTIRKIKGDDL